MLATPNSCSLNALVAHAQAVARMGWARLLTDPPVSVSLEKQLQTLCERTTGVQQLVDVWRQTALHTDSDSHVAASRDLARSVARELGGGAVFVEAVQDAKSHLDEKEGETLLGWAREFARTKHEIAEKLESLVGRHVVRLAGTMSKEEATQAASEAVLRAVDYFSPAHGADFTQYALRCVARALAPSSEPRVIDLARSGKAAHTFASMHTRSAPRPLEAAYERIDWAVSALAPLEVALLRQRYGLGGEEARSLSDLCREFEMPRRQVVRILKDAQAKVARLLTAAGCLESESEVRTFVPPASAIEFPQRAFRRSA